MTPLTILLRKVLEEECRADYELLADGEFVLRFGIALYSDGTPSFSFGAALSMPERKQLRFVGIAIRGLMPHAQRGWFPDDITLEISDPDYDPSFPPAHAAAVGLPSDASTIEVIGKLLDEGHRFRRSSSE